MKLIKSVNNNFLFSPLWKRYSLLLFFVGVFCQGFGQIHIGKNATFSIQKGTLLHISEIRDEKLPTVKVYVGKNAKLINFSTNSVVEIVYVKKGKLPKETILQNKSKKDLPPTMVKKNTKTESRKSVLSFVPRQTTPSTLFYSGNTTKAALVQNISWGNKFFPPKKLYNSIVHSLFLKNNPQISISSNKFLLIQKASLEEHITRPPPFRV